MLDSSLAQRACADSTNSPSRRHSRARVSASWSKIDPSRGTRQEHSRKRDRRKPSSGGAVPCGHAASFAQARRRDGTHAARMSKWLGLVCCVMVFTPFGCDDSSDSNASGGSAGAAGSGGTAGAATGGAGGSGGTTDAASGGAAGGDASATGGSAGSTTGGTGGVGGDPSDAGDGATCQALGTSCTLPTQCCSNKCGPKSFCCGPSGTECQTDNDCCPGTCKADGTSSTGKRCKTAA